MYFFKIDLLVDLVLVPGRFCVQLYVPDSNGSVHSYVARPPRPATYTRVRAPGAQWWHAGRRCGSSGLPWHFCFWSMVVPVGLLVLLHQHLLALGEVVHSFTVPAGWTALHGICTYVFFLSGAPDKLLWCDIHAAGSRTSGRSCFG